MKRLHLNPVIRVPAAKRHRSFLRGLPVAALPAGRPLAARLAPVARVLARVASRATHSSWLTVNLAVHRLARSIVQRAEKSHWHSISSARTHTREIIERLLAREHTVNTRVREARFERPLREIHSRELVRGPVETRIARAPSAAMVVARSAPAAPAAARPEPVRAAAATTHRSESVQAQLKRADAVALPPRELQRVADHVIQQLDRRVLSWQERRGQG